VQALHERLGGVVTREDVATAIARLAEAQAVVRSGDRVVASIAYAEPHTDAELSTWVTRNGAPAHEATPEPLPVAAGA
jgi:hypothetical protein